MSVLGSEGYPTERQDNMNKFKIDDKVKVIADKERLKDCFADELLTGKIGVIADIKDDDPLSYMVEINDRWWLAEQDIALACIAASVPVPAESEHTLVEYPNGELEVKCNRAIAEAVETAEQESIRTFGSGATRDTTQGKLDYVKALSPIVIRRYVQYLDKHRLQSDGSYRDFDNWKKGIPQETYHSSGGRHFFDAWLLTEGYTTEDNHGPVDIEDVLCAQLFNIQGRLHEILKAKLAVDRTKPVPGGY